MFDITALTPFVVALVVFGCAATGLAIATLVRLAVEAKPRTRPVVLVATERATLGQAA